MGSLVYHTWRVTMCVASLMVSVCMMRAWCSAYASNDMVSNDSRKIKSVADLESLVASDMVSLEGRWSRSHGAIRHSRRLGRLTTGWSNATTRKGRGAGPSLADAKYNTSSKNRGQNPQP